MKSFYFNQSINERVLQFYGYFNFLGEDFNIRNKKNKVISTNYGVFIKYK